MDKPDYDLKEIPMGQIFQISPEGLDPTQVEYGGDFLIALKYEEWGVYGYLAMVLDKPNINRSSGAAFVNINWKYLQFVGSCFWVKQQKEENGNSDGDSTQV